MKKLIHVILPAILAFLAVLLGLGFLYLMMDVTSRYLEQAKKTEIGRERQK